MAARGVATGDTSFDADSARRRLLLATARALELEAGKEARCR